MAIVIGLVIIAVVSFTSAAIDYWKLRQLDKLEEEGK